MAAASTGDQAIPSFTVPEAEEATQQWDLGTLIWSADTNMTPALRRKQGCSGSALENPRSGTIHHARQQKLMGTGEERSQLAMAS